MAVMLIFDVIFRLLYICEVGIAVLALLLLWFLCQTVVDAIKERIAP